MGQKPRTELTRLEFDVMRALWDLAGSSGTVRDVLTRLNQGRPKKLAYTTVQTVLLILKDKGAVLAKPGPGRAHLFSPQLSQEDVTTGMVSDLVERLFGGKVQPLLHRLVDHDSLRAEDLKDLKQWIESRLDDEPE